MSDNEEQEEKSFPQEEIEAIVLPIIEETIKDKNWEETLIPHWINEISERSIAGLTDLGKTYKYVVTCVITQKISATINSSIGCHWGNQCDGYHIMSYPPPTRGN